GCDPEIDFLRHFCPCSSNPAEEEDVCQPDQPFQHRYRCFHRILPVVSTQPSKAELNLCQELVVPFEVPVLQDLVVVVQLELGGFREKDVDAGREILDLVVGV